MSYGCAVGFFYNLNLIVGSGFLAIPYVLVRSGLLTGVLTLLVVAFFSALTARWILETMYRGEAILHLRSSRLNAASPSVSGSHQQIPAKLEVGELCEMFGGLWARFGYDISNFISAEIALWGYGTLAGSAWSANIPFDSPALGQCGDEDFRGHSHPADDRCWNSYALCVLSFGVVVIPLSCVELSEQKVVQLFLGVVRLLMIISMSIYSLVGEIKNPGCWEKETEFPHTNYSINETYNECKEVWTSFSFDGWILVFPLVTGALYLHLGIPTLTQPIKDKRNLGSLMTALFIACTFLYTFIGVSVGVRYKDQVVETCTLTWVPTTKSPYSTIERIYSYLVVLYPSLDICSAYPIMVTILSNIFLVDYELVTKTKSTRAMRFVSRFLIATVPLIGSQYVSNLVQIGTYTGVFCCISTFLFPALILASVPQTLCGFQLPDEHACGDACSSGSWNPHNVWGTEATLIQCVSRRTFRLEFGLINDAEIERKDEEGTPLIASGKSHRPRGYVFDIHKDTPYTDVLSGDVMVIVVTVFGVWATCATVGSFII